MDHLLAARARKLRGRLRFQKDVDAELRRLQLKRDNLELVISRMITVEGHMLARTDGYFQEFMAIARIPDKQFRAMAAESSCAFLEMLDAAAIALRKKLVGALRDTVKSSTIELLPDDTPTERRL